MGDCVMKKKSTILIIVFILLAVIYIIRGILSDRVIKESLYRGTIEDSINTKGLVIKNEKLYSPKVKGVLDSQFSSGDRVAAGSLVAVIYKGSVDPDVKNRLEQVNRKIAILETNQAKNATFSNDISKLEHEISSNVDEIIKAGYNKNMEKITAIKYTISALAEHKAAIEGNTKAKSQTLESLRQTKADLETQIGVAQSSIYAENAGVFSSYIDGLEDLITPKNMKELTVSKFNELYNFDEENVKNSTEKNDTYACKIIDNFVYYISFIADSEKLAKVKVGDSAKIRFYDISANSVQTKVSHISKPENGKCVVILECNTFHEGLLEKRFVNIDFIKKSYSGFRVNVDALRTKDNANGIYVLREKILTFIPVNVLYNSGEVLIVDSADKNNPLKLYDEVVINASEFREGQMID